MESKPVILLNWPYYRQDWISPFVRLKDSFEFIFLSYSDPKFHDVNFGFKQLFWSDFDSAFDLLDYAKPHKVVFMGIESGYSVALNIASQKRNIMTYVLQHGLMAELSIYLKQERLNRSRPPIADKKEYETDKTTTIKFVFNTSKRCGLITLILSFLYLIISKHKGVQWASMKMPLSFRKPNYYICFTRHSSKLYEERDKVNHKKIIEIGNPLYDRFFTKEVTKKNDTSRYYLLIDSPFVENRYHSHDISEEVMNSFYAKLNSFCKENGAKLFVKLHPESYQSTFMLKDENIVYIKNEPIEGLILNSLGCFGTFSTLIIPAIFFKPCILFLLDFSRTKTQDHIVELGAVWTLDFFDFVPSDIEFTTKDNKVSELFEKAYLFRGDGKSIHRLASVLNKDVS